MAKGTRAELPIQGSEFFQTPPGETGRTGQAHVPQRPEVSLRSAGDQSSTFYNFDDPDRIANAGRTAVAIANSMAGLRDLIPAWVGRALCAQTDPEAFFPEKGGSALEAKRICARCEVKSECLEYALDRKERFGIWGGMTPGERRRLKRGIMRTGKQD